MLTYICLSIHLPTYLAVPPCIYLSTSSSVNKDIYIYVCVCMHVCMCECMHACMHACMYIYMFTCIYVCMYVCVYVCMYVCIHVCMYTCMYVCIHVCKFLCTYVYPSYYQSHRFHVSGGHHRRQCAPGGDSDGELGDRGVSVGRGAESG